MSQTDKPSLADIARKNNSARTSKFASSMVPAAPQMTTELEQESPAATISEPVEAVKERAPEPPVADSSDMAPAPASRPDPVAETSASARPTRRRSSALSLSDDILSPKAPEEEAYGKMTRIAEKHHELLRKIAYEHRKPMNTILYNLLEVLEQTYQRDQQKNV